MKVITYLGFTVLSIFIQFCVMDFIQEKIETDNESQNLNVSPKKTLNELLKNISSKPHALYYRTQTRRSLRTNSLSIYNNSSIPVMLVTTDATTTLFDVLYDENTSDTEVTSTTEIYFTSTEYDNITEITFFDNKNKTSNIPPLSTTPKTNNKDLCECDLLFKVCDINCCCDQDCYDLGHDIFQCSTKSKTYNNQNKPDTNGCISYLFDERRYRSSMLDNLFCVVKTNLPIKRSIRKLNPASIGQYYKWQSFDQKQTLIEFKKTLYKYADPVWLLKNEIIYYLDFPASTVNNYCTDRVPIAFLKEEKIRCNVKFKDLEMFNILKTCEEAMVISATDKTLNGTQLNCSNLHCINWTVLACENGMCKNYNKSSNEVTCTETTCTNVALKIDYDFYYYDLKITNATIRLHIQNISNSLPFMSQEVSIHFYIANKSIDLVTQLSGNPGYNSGLPVIVSYVRTNFTENFYNNTLERRSYLDFPENINGLCQLSNTSNNIVKFGLNKRTKCRYVLPYETLSKVLSSNMCKNIQNDINQLLRLNSNISISPYGNPHDLTDDNWLSLHIGTTSQEPVYGEYNEKSLKLNCYNLVTRLSVIFTYANVDENEYLEQNKILSARYEVATNNQSFHIEDVSTVITIDINFVDITKPSVFEYAGSPHLNIYLPKDFFFPFPSNSCSHLSTAGIMLLCCVIVFLQIK